MFGAKAKQLAREQRIAAAKHNREEYEARVRGLVKIAEDQEQQNQRFADCIDELEKRIENERIAREANAQLLGVRIDGIIRRTPAPGLEAPASPAAVASAPGDPSSHTPVPGADVDVVEVAA